VVERGNTEDCGHASGRIAGAKHTPPAFELTGRPLRALQD
jgi:hypothetical protein